MSSYAELPNKKIYRTPTLTKYGNLLEMTKANTNMGATKDGIPANSKTVV
jgi:hypothetical protein